MRSSLSQLIVFPLASGCFLPRAVNSFRLLPAFVLFGALLGLAPPIHAATCNPNPGYNIQWNIESFTPVPSDELCPQDSFRCPEPELTGGPFLQQAGPGKLRLTVLLDFPGTEQNQQQFGPVESAYIHWYDNPTPGANRIGLCRNIFYDQIRTYLEISGVTCANLEEGTHGPFSVRAWSCAGGYCPKKLEISGLEITQGTAGALLGCEEPPMEPCPSEQSCAACRSVGPAGGNLAGSGGAASPPGSGPGGGLSYYAGGAGAPGTPGAPSSAVLGEDGRWRLITRSSGSLGRYWMHPWAEHLVHEPGATAAEDVTWLVTRNASFRKFSQPDGSGIYQRAAPTDEMRTLTNLSATGGTGWELESLDGTVQRFDAAGRWTETEDRHGNLTTAVYSGADLTGVLFPDGRSLAFTYAGGKLDTITEVGSDGVTSRTWDYTWSGDDLQQIDRPDGRSWLFEYGDPAHPGYLTLMKLLGNEDPMVEPRSERIEAGLAYDAEGNTVALWRGASSPMDAGAVDLWTWAFDNPVLPTETTVTDPLGNTAVVEIGRDTRSRKGKVKKITGDCPSCGLGPNADLAYEDPAHPLRPTSETDGGGHLTLTTYTAEGQVASRTEAAGTPEERTTWFTYDATYPALVESITRPSTAGGAAVRESFTTWSGGVPTQRTESGIENGAAFTYTTVNTYTTEGLLETVNPPGHASDDLVTYAYDAAKGGVVLESRTDPLIGTTLFDHDPFHRRTGETDPNGVRSSTAYDLGDRVTEVRQEAATTPVGDLVTTYEHTPLGDLFRTTLPRGNVIEYGWDAAGRLISVEHKPDAATPGERVLYELDGAGNRIREKHQSWDGTAWFTEAETQYVRTTRCRLDRMIQAPGTPEESVTDYQFDCDGNLTHVWDGLHDPMTDPPSQSYEYDPLHRVTAVKQYWDPSGTDPSPPEVVTAYGFDVQDHLTSVTDAEGNVTLYTYSDRDLLTEEDSPVSGVTTHTYTPSGELETTTDARGVTTVRTYDELDRLTFVDFPETFPGEDLDTTYSYDDPAAPFSLGRLTAITRAGESVDYRYDRFGRTTQDGGLTYLPDENGNLSEIGYPGGVTAVYQHDFADRPVSLTVERSGLADQPLVTAAEYLPGGPLSSLALGNGLTEDRAYDGRYAPAGITVNGGVPVLDWDYTVDPVGNPTAITDGLDPSRNRTYTYQAPQYYLTSGDGPWGTRSWSYDAIGGRLTETQGGITDSYLYDLNPGAGNTPRLSSVQLGVGGSRTYAYSPAGHLEEVALLSNPTDQHLYDAAGRLAWSGEGGTGTRLDYDGRSFLRRTQDGTDPASPLLFTDSFESSDPCAWDLVDGETMPTTCPPEPAPYAVEPVYSSEGLLHSLLRSNAPAGTPDTEHVFYLAGRPVAQLSLTGGAETWRFLTTDHLGTPVMATDMTGAVTWEGGFEPFGADYAGAGAAGLVLRFPGQWVDGGWDEVEEYYNVHRWYGWAEGRYGRVDPLRRVFPNPPYIYSSGNPLSYVDPLGLHKTRFPHGGPNHYLYEPSENDFQCVARIRDQVRREADGQTRYQHCLANCLITKQCPSGRSMAVIASITKEFGDLGRCLIQRKGGNCNSAFQPADFDDNSEGRQCPDQVPCQEHCNDLLGEQEPVPGPFERLNPDYQDGSGS